MSLLEKLMFWKKPPPPEPKTVEDFIAVFQYGFESLTRGAVKALEKLPEDTPEAAAERAVRMRNLMFGAHVAFRMRTAVIEDTVRPMMDRNRWRAYEKGIEEQIEQFRKKGAAQPSESV